MCFDKNLILHITVLVVASFYHILYTNKLIYSLYLFTLHFMCFVYYIILYINLNLNLAIHIFSCMQVHTIIIAFDPNGNVISINRYCLHSNMSRNFKNYVVF